MTIARLLRNASRKTAIAGAVTLGLALGCVNTSYAGAREQAWRMYERLTGTPPTNAVLAKMTTCINDGSSPSTTCTSGLSNSEISSINSATLSTGASRGQVAAAFQAMQDKNFLNVVVKNMVMPWTNKDQTVFFPFNDAAATLIGLIRDGTDFRKALYADTIYIGDPSQMPSDVPAYSASNDQHYIHIEHDDLNLRDVLKNVSQTNVDPGHPIPSEAIAGVLTTRASTRAFFYAGTNRAMLRFTFMNYMCNDFVQIKDINSNPDRIRQDPSRSPGGDSTVFLHNCIGCHSGMDGLAGAFAYYNWGPVVFDDSIDPDTQSMTYATGPSTFTLTGKQFTTRVMPKYLQNFTSFPDGYETKDDSWINYWRTGLDANLGWGWAVGESKIASQHTTTGNGMASLGQELANTYAFSQCQALTVYRHVCYNDPSASTLSNMVNDFKNNSFDMRTLFSEAAADCSSNMN